MRDLSKRIANLPDDKRDLLDVLLRDEGLDVSSLPMRSRRSSGSTSFPLSFAQQRMWFLNQLTPDDPFYNMAIALRVSGELNRPVLEATLNTIVQRHKVLRTTFHMVEGQPVQTIRAHRPLLLRVDDLTALSATEREAKVHELAMAEGQQVFDLTRGPLLSLRILQLGRAESVLLLTMQHIVADGWSIGVLQRELARLYKIHSGRPSVPPPELPIQYADFAQWQRETLRGSMLDTQLGYWRHQLDALPPMLRLPTDRPRPAEQTFHGRRFEIELPVHLSEQLKQYGQRQGGTLFMVLLGAFQLLLSHYTGQHDIVVGSPIANRNRREIENLIGFFANSLVLRTDLSGNPTFQQLLERVREMTLGAYAHQDIPFEMLVEHLQPTRHLSHNPLFQVVFALQSAPLPPFELHGLEIQPLELDNETTRFDLELHLWDRTEGIIGYFIYNTDLFDLATIQRMSECFATLLAAIADHPERPIAELPWAHSDVALSPQAVGEKAHPVEVEAALLQHPLVDDCVVLARATTASDDALVAYVVWTGNIGAVPLSPASFPMLPPYLPPLYIVPVTSLPLTAAGEIDEAALMRLEVIDTALAEQWEARLKAIPGIDQVAVLSREIEITQPPLHLADLIPGWETWSQADGDHRPREDEADQPTASGNAASPLETSRSRLTPAISHGGPLEIADDAPRSLIGMLCRAAARWPDHGLIYLQPDGTEMTQTYPELLDDAVRILAGLRGLGLKPRDPVILQLAHNQDFIPGFWGCVLGGLVPIPLAVAPTYEGAAHSAVNRLLNTWQTLGTPLILASATIAPDIHALGQGPYEGLQVAAIEDLRRSTPHHRIHEPAPDDVTLLLLTSGSTGQPKAVMQNHRSLLSRSISTAQMNDFSSQDISLNWMPLDHVGGIVMSHLLDVYLGSRQIHAPIAQVLQQPLLWLDWIEHYRVTITWAPNFAFGLINTRAEELAQRHWDLSSMRFILNAGEPIVPKTTRRFLQGLKPHGLSPTCMFPGWGMSETCSAVTFCRPFSLEDTTDDDTFTNLGDPIPGVSIRIVDDQDALVSEGAIGQLQITGETVTSGYYQLPDLNAETFTADVWMRTGDLGMICDGQLIITGREKDVIIINGVNYYSHEIEALVEAVAGVEVSYTAACAVREASSDTDRLAIFFSPSTGIDNDQPADVLELLGHVRQQVLQNCGVNPAYIIPLSPEEIPKTAIGKIQRTALKQRFEAGDYRSELKKIDILRGNANTMPDWFYRKIWRRAARWRDHHRTISQAASPACSLLFVDRLGLGQEVAQSLTEANGRCVVVEADTAFTQLASVVHGIAHNGFGRSV